jgi:hypothetical protein
MKRELFAALFLCLPLMAGAETPEEWITLGARVHGAFGAFDRSKLDWMLLVA